jgi:predicted CoA-substrate-specific enzyme activase
MLEYINPSKKKIRSLGLCLGASTVSAACVEEIFASSSSGDGPISDSIRLLDHQIYPHNGNPKKTLLSVLDQFAAYDFKRIAVTGRRFRHFVKLSSIPEPEAIEYAYQFIKPKSIDSPAIISAGGETFMVYVLNRLGQVSNVITGNKCASGTGEFFLQQLRRMDVSLSEAVQWSKTEKPYAVSGRCSVFCKSDCTHAINKGVPKSRVTAGLCRMMANKILELLKKVEKKNMMIVGGSTQNQMMMSFLKEEIPSLIVPESAPYFEALGAALWALANETKSFGQNDDLFNPKAASFKIHPPLRNASHQVTFKTLSFQTPQPGDVCIFGLDVGSTTTKAVLVRKSDNAILASIYKKTDGDPVGASRKCYQSISDQISNTLDPSTLNIEGLGVCGSGRQIAGLHAMTDGIINEIIAHATAAVHFDPDVDTIFEIGGQDAKYTYITAGVPSDYAMNEACSAGTGSFLEEAAYETLGITLEDIANKAIKGKNPPNFNDQCAAFISSDIKTAVHEGIGQQDIVAGLVYSICMNYNNRVKGNRPVGRKVFMQGGVCYNQAVPLAMAALSGKPIIVPPEPGLMGAYGAALEVKKRISLGLMKPQSYNLQELAHRQVQYDRSFSCTGGKEKCDRHCEINVVMINDKKFLFGGACNRYYNLRRHLKYDISGLNMVRKRENIIFKKYAGDLANTTTPTSLGSIGINKSFMVNTLYPFYHNFFMHIGVNPVIPSEPSPKGIDCRNAAFCYPAELSHGFFDSLLKNNSRMNYIFLPHLRSIPAENGHTSSLLCPFAQGEPFYLKSAFKSALDAAAQKGTVVLTPLIDMKKDLSEAQAPLVDIALKIGVKLPVAESAFSQALDIQRRCNSEMKSTGRKLLVELESDPQRFSVVIFGRSYNAMVEESHMGIPYKFATRGIQVIPYDFLPIDEEKSISHMYWGTGQSIMKGARFVEKHPQLFGVYITNFSCGPDSFLITYFRNIMDRKPSLTLELDSHTADTGLETRIEAFLDIVSQYRQLLNQKSIKIKRTKFISAQTFLDNGTPMVTTSTGRLLSMKDPDVTLLIPSMGRLSTEAISAVFSQAGYHVAPHPPADETVLKTGRANTTCKECLPLILTTGTLLNYAYTQKKPDEILVYFMPTTSGPCRFGQYAVFMQQIIDRMEIPDVAIFALTSDNTYFGMGKGFNYYKAWWAIIISDVMEDIRSMLMANAVNVGYAMDVFERNWQRIVRTIQHGGYSDLMDQLNETMSHLSRLPVKKPPALVPKILLTGEIFVRRDSLSRQSLTEWLAESGFAVICSPVSEWIRYSDYMIHSDPAWKNKPLSDKIRFHIRQWLMNLYENRLTAAMSKSGLVASRHIDIQHIIDTASGYLSPKLGGEAILTIGSSLAEIATHVCGVIAIGPFGCMPNRLSEAILAENMTRRSKMTAPKSGAFMEEILSGMDELPFLAIESDGSPFPQLITAKLEAFCRRALRLHRQMPVLN